MCNAEYALERQSENQSWTKMRWERELDETGSAGELVCVE